MTGVQTCALPISNSIDPDILVETPAAISTRVAPSFLRVGQIELFARRVRNNEHQDAMKELEMIVKHLIIRNYKEEIDPNLSFSNQVVEQIGRASCSERVSTSV